MSVCAVSVPPPALVHSISTGNCKCFWGLIQAHSFFIHQPPFLFPILYGLHASCSSLFPSFAWSHPIAIQIYSHFHCHCFGSSPLFSGCVCVRFFLLFTKSVWFWTATVRKNEEAEEEESKIIMCSPNKMEKICAHPVSAPIHSQPYIALTRHTI